jgi:hypothetical protein
VGNLADHATELLIGDGIHSDVDVPTNRLELSQFMAQRHQFRSVSNSTVFSPANWEQGMPSRVAFVQLKQNWMDTFYPTAASEQ